MGRGGANLGKPLKGKSKERKKDKKGKAKENVTEKQLNDDIKMLEEYEKLNKLAEAQRVRLKKLQQQETYNTRINKKILINIHRKFLRGDKVDQLRKEVEILAQNHEREVDRKDAIIQMLTRDLDDAEEQFQTAQRNHMDKQNKFFELYTSKTRRLEEEFERDLKALKLEFNSEKEMIVQRYTRENKEMKGIIAAVEAQEAERITDAKQAHETEREGIRNTNLEGINELRINLENKIEDLEKQFDDAHTNYVEGTETANKQFKDLEGEDKTLSKKIDSKKRKIERMQEQLSHWKKKLQNNHKECIERNQTLREQKEAIAKHCNALKSRMKKFRTDEAKKLTELTVLARDALRANQEKLVKSEKILALAELGRKLETEREKVQPFYESTVKSEHQENNVQKFSQLEEYQKQQKAPVFAQAYDKDGKPVNQWGFLENVHKKFNKVLLDKLAIIEEKKRLAKENEDLRSILKQYLDGIAITEDVVDIDNPLLIVNGKVNLLDQGRAVRRQGRPTTITEATQVVRSQMAQGY